MKEIKNRIANSNLIVIDIKDFKPKGERVLLDISPFLYQGLILKEKEFRQAIEKINLEDYKDKYVAINCSVDAILPEWAYFLLTVKLFNVTKRIVIGDLIKLEDTIIIEKLLNTDYQVYKNKKIVIKGCDKDNISINVLNIFLQNCLPFAQSIMFGEACSTLPIYKKPKV